MTPAATLRIELVRRRACGEPFTLAWPGAIEVALDGIAHREEWRVAIAWSRSDFAAAYARRGTARLAAAVEARELAEILAETVRPPAGAGGRRLVPLAKPGRLPVEVEAVE